MNSHRMNSDCLFPKQHAWAHRHRNHWLIRGVSTMSTTIDMGISETDRMKIAASLSKLLADTYSLYLKTHNFH
jgi:hypothetical protein